jgi:hypothetical protein
MPRVKHSTDEKRQFARQWMKDNPDKVTANGVYEAIKVKFKEGVGKQVAIALANEFRGKTTAPTAGKKPKQTKGKKSKGKKPKMKTAKMIAATPEHSTKPLREVGDAVVEFSREVRTALATIRNAGIKSVEFAPGGAPRIRF